MSRIKETMPILLSGTPLSHDLIKAGWPHFSFSEKAEILTAQPMVGRYWHGQQYLKELGLADENPLIRRLAAKSISKPSNSDTPEMAKEAVLWAKVQEDPDIRVRETWDEDTWGSFFGIGRTPEWFWAQPQYRRLTTVHGSNDAKWVADAFDYAISHGLFKADEGGVSNDEALDIILQFLHWPEGRKRGADDDRWKDSTGIAELWKVTIHPGLPLRLRGVLLQQLPDSGISAEIQILLRNSLTEEEFVWLLEREDFNPYGMRLELLKTGSSKLKEAALSSPNFRLSDEEFAAYLPVPQDSTEVRQEKLRQVHMLGLHYEGATLPQLVALSTMSSWHHKEWSTLGDENRILTPDISERVERRVGSLLKWWEVRDESRLARWMFFAGRIAASSADEHDYPDQIKGHLLVKLKAAVVPGDLWATYTALRNLRPKWMVDMLPPLLDMFDYDAIPIQFRGQDPDTDEPINLAVEAERQLKQVSKETRVILDLASFAINGLHQEIKNSRETATVFGSGISNGGWRSIPITTIAVIGVLGWFLISTALRMLK